MVFLMGGDYRNNNAYGALHREFLGPYGCRKGLDD
jgi:hypothetical protein